MSLPTAVAGDDRTPAWMGQAACRGTDVALFFAEKWDGHGTGDTAKAKAVCASCPVQPECLDYALDNNEEHGTWGGRTARERRVLRRARRLTRTHRDGCACVSCRWKQRSA